MPDVTKRLLTDETGQSIVTALGALTNVVDPNGTTVAAAQKLNNMTVSATVLPAGATPTSSLTEVNGHFHLTLGVPVELPTVDSNDDGKFLMVENGAWSPVSLGEGGGLMSDEEKEKLDNLGEIDIYKTTESASIASVTDGADGMPMRKVEVAIEPVQDLHGYDSPWPAGGGKNLFDISAIVPLNANVTVTKTSTGFTFSNANSYGCNIFRGQNGDIIWALDEGTYALSMESAINSNISIYASDDGSSFSWYANGIPSGNITGAFTVTGEKYVKLMCNVESNVSITINKFQFEKGSTASSWTPYSNVCPITGWTGCKVTRCGKNIWHGTLSPSAFVQFDTKPGQTYTVSAKRKGTDDCYLYVQESEDGFQTRTLVGRVLYGQNTSVVTFTAEAGKGYGMWSNTSYTEVEQLQIELGSSKTAYEPYQGETYNISWQTEAGTVYGGTLDAVSGKLKITHAQEILDGSEKNLQFRSTAVTGGVRRFNTWGFAYTGNKRYYKKTANGNTYSNSYKCAFDATGSVGCVWINSNNSLTITLPDQTVSTEADADTYIAQHPVTLILELETPLAPIQLDPTEITTLLGINNVYADCGNTAITYPTETSGLINTYDKIKIDTIPTKVSQLQNDSGYINSNPEMTGATDEDDGTSGLVPAPSAGDENKFLSGDGTYKSGGLPMVILSYGNSTWSEFINAYNNNVIVYCRASSNANPATGAQTRMAFMAYVNDATSPTNVEFQYYRSMNPNNKSISQMSDQIFVYKLASSGTWSVETREAGLKSVVFDASSGLTGTYDKTTGTLTIAAAT